MKRAAVLFVSLLISAMVGIFPVCAGQTGQLNAKISDIDARPLEGAKLFLYDSPNVRRPADFISSQSDRTGRVRIVLPPGRYWVVARYKADGKYGPLLPGDKHSGEPLEVEVTGSEVAADFVVADIREIGQKKRAGATDAVHLKGRVLDATGAPVAQAYVHVSGTREFSEFPEYLSAWTGEDGEYEVYLPATGTYFVGASRRFPLPEAGRGLVPLVVEPGKIDIALDINLTVQ
jgi:hypothetical protein